MVVTPVRVLTFVLLLQNYLLQILIEILRSDSELAFRCETVTAWLTLHTPVTEQPLFNTIHAL